MNGIQFTPMENGLIRVYSLYTRSVIGLAETFEKAQEMARDHIRRVAITPTTGNQWKLPDVEKLIAEYMEQQRR